MLLSNYYRKSKCYNMEAWDNQSANILFIGGYAGSGKTTLGKELSRYYNCPMYQVDGMNDLIKKEKGEKFVRELKRNRSDWEDYRMFYMINKNGDKRAIIEGIRSIDFDKEKYREYPLIIVGTGFIKSTWNAFIRGFRKTQRMMYGIQPFFHVRWNLKMMNSMNQLKIYMDGESSK